MPEHGDEEPLDVARHDVLASVEQRPAASSPLEREEGKGRNIHYRLRSYAGVKPQGERY